MWRNDEKLKLFFSNSLPTKIMEEKRKIMLPRKVKLHRNDECQVAFFASETSVIKAR